MAGEGGKLGAAIVAFARAHLGKKVGDGECFALADKALRRAGAKSAADYGEITDDADYIWGDPVDLKDVAPGDILQFRDFDIDTRTDTTTELPKGGEKTEWKERVATRGHHTAVVEKILATGALLYWSSTSNHLVQSSRDTQYRSALQCFALQGQGYIYYCNGYCNRHDQRLPSSRTLTAKQSFSLMGAIGLEWSSLNGRA